MAANANGLAQLELIQKRELSEQETNILQAFSLAMRPGVPDAAAEAARQLDALCPPLERDKEARDYIWSVWDIMFDIAASPDATDEVHFSLVAVLRELAQISRGHFNHDEPTFRKRVWEDLPSIAVSFEVNYSDPSYQPAEQTERLVQNWYKLAMFGARALAAQVLGPYNELMGAIRCGLETPVAEMKQAEWSVKLACAWLTYGSAIPLLKWAQENLEDDNVVHDTNYFERGPLYDGPAVMCFERWQFWLQRLDELASQESGLSQETRQSVLNAAQTMNEAWNEMASLYSQSEASGKPTKIAT